MVRRVTNQQSAVQNQRKKSETFQQNFQKLNYHLKKHILKKRKEKKLKQQAATQQQQSELETSFSDSGNEEIIIKKQKKTKSQNNKKKDPKAKNQQNTITKKKTRSQQQKSSPKIQKINKKIQKESNKGIRIKQIIDSNEIIESKTRSGISKSKKNTSSKNKKNNENNDNNNEIQKKNNQQQQIKRSKKLVINEIEAENNSDEKKQKKKKKLVKKLPSLFHDSHSDNECISDDEEEDSDNDSSYSSQQSDNYMNQQQQSLDINNQYLIEEDIDNISNSVKKSNNNNMGFTTPVKIMKNDNNQNIKQQEQDQDQEYYDLEQLNSYRNYDDFLQSSEKKTIIQDNDDDEDNNNNNDNIITVNSANSSCNKSIYRKKIRTSRSKRLFQIDSPVKSSESTLQQQQNFFNNQQNMMMVIDQDENSHTDTLLNNQQDNYFQQKILFQNNNNRSSNIIDKLIKSRQQQVKYQPVQQLSLRAQINKNIVNNSIKAQENRKMQEVQDQINSVYTSHKQLKQVFNQHIQAFKQQPKNIPLFQKIQAIQEQVQSRIKLDTVICIDATLGMTKYLQKCKDVVLNCFKKCTQNDINLKIGLVLYRDHPPEDDTFVTKILDLSNNLESIIQFIDSIGEGIGGGDVPDAVMDGLWDSLKKTNWRYNSNKYIIHICDGPPHGKLYESTNRFMDQSFMWKGGCPCQITIEKISKIMNQYNFCYRLVKVGDKLKQMSKIFKQNIQDYKELKIKDENFLDKYIAGMLLNENLQIEDIE